MTTEAIPKLLFIDEDIQQLCDQRLGRKQIIDTKNNENQVSKSWQYKFHSQIKLAQGYQLEAQPGGGQKQKQIEDNSIKTSIFNAVYCNKNGKLFYNSKKGIAVYDIKQLQVMVKTGNTPTPSIVNKQCGSLFLSPNQTKLLVINSDNIYTYSVEGAFTLIKKIQNQFTFTNVCWENEEYVYLWSFLNPLYYLMTSTGELVGINDIERCTGVNRINKNFIAAFELLQQEGGAQNAFLYLYKQRSKIKRIQISKLKNQDNPLFQYLTFIGIAKLNNIQQLQLGAEDLYVVSAVYYRAYQQNDEQPCHRYLFFMQGNLHDESIKVRKHELINSLQESQQLYIDVEKNKKFAFSCIFYHFDTFVTVLFQKSQQVYFIDATQKFQKLNKYQTWPKHIFKINPQKAPNNPYFKAMIPFRNMLQFQRQPSADTKGKELIYYNQQHKGQFLQLFFEHKEATLTFEFPPSIICLTDGFLFKKYAAYIADSCQQQQKIQEYVKQKKRSRYILPISQKIQIKNIQRPQQQKQTTIVKQQDNKQAIKDKQQIIKQQQSQKTQPVKIKQQILKQNQTKQAAKKQNESSKPIQPRSQTQKIQKQHNKKIQQPQNQQQDVIKTLPKAEQPSKLFSPINQNKPVFNMFASTPTSNIFAGSTLFNKPIQVKSTNSQKDGIKSILNFNLSNLSLASKPNEQKRQDSSKKQTIKAVQEKKTSWIFASASQIGNNLGMDNIPNKVQQNNLIKSQSKNILQQNQKKQVKSQGLFNANIRKETSSGFKSVFPGSAQPFSKNQSLQGTFNLNLSAKPQQRQQKPFGFSFNQPSPKIFNQPPLILNQLSGATKPTLKPSQQTKNFTSNIPNPKPKQSPSTFAKQAQQPLKKNQIITKQVNTKQTQLKIKLQDFKKQINLVDNKIDSYKSDQKTPVLFNLTNAQNLIYKWNQVFEVPFEKSFDEIGKVLIKIDKYEKFQKNKIVKKLNEENSKSQVTKNYKQINKTIDSLCYFVSFFTSNNKGQNNDNSTFRSVLKKPYIQNKKQQEKFISALTKNIKDIQKCSQALNHKYRSERDKQKNKQRIKHKKSYKFDVNLQSQESQSDSQLSKTLFYKYQKQKQKRQQDKYLKQVAKSGQITLRDLIGTLQKYQSIVQYVDNPKPLFTYAPLQQASKPKQNQKSKLNQPQKIGSMIQTAKPFDSKLIQINVKKQDKRVIPNLQGTQIQKNKSIAGSEKADQQFEDLQIPNASLRTISKVPLLIPPKKQQKSAVFGSFGQKDNKNLKQQEAKPKLFGNNPSKASFIEAPKPKQKQPIFGFGIKKDGKSQQQQVTNKTKNPENLFNDNTQNQKKSQKKQQATTILRLPTFKKTQSNQKQLFGSSFAISSESFANKNEDKKIQSKIEDLSKQKQPTTIFPKKIQQKIQNSKSITNLDGEQKKSAGNSLPFLKESTNIKNQQNSFTNKTLFNGNLFNFPVNNKNTTNLNKSQIKTDVNLQQKKDVPSTNVTETKKPPKIQQKQTPIPIKKQNPILSQSNTQVCKQQQKKSTQSTSQSQTKFPTLTKTPQPQNNLQAKPTTTDFKSISTTQNNSFLKMNQNNNQAQSNKNSSQSAQSNLFKNNQQTQQQQNNAFNNQQNQPINSLMQSHASTTFGGGNRFMANNTTTNAGVNQNGFNPNQMQFGIGTNSNLKSFSSIGASGGNLFVNQNQQSQGWFSSANNGQNNSWLNSGAGTQNNQQNQQAGSWIAGNNQQQQGMATQQNNGWFTNTNQNQSNQTNQFNQFNQGNTGSFLSSFNQMNPQPWAQSSTPNALLNNNFNQGTLQTPPNVSQSMFQPRK